MWNLIAAFKIFNTARPTWCGNVLNSSYRDSIFSFERAYKALRILITPKVHAVIKHIPEFLTTRQKSMTSPSENSLQLYKKIFQEVLCLWGEQASESVHAGFIRLWEINAYKQH